ncbi:hypothetical protein K1719_036115 [Acacia pycnantha]|nr:hypothetical protein K1719_036115 [Acacia pycnantha]
MGTDKGNLTIIVSEYRGKGNGQVMLHDTGVSDCSKKQGLDSVEDVGQYYGDDMEDNGGDKISLVSADADQVQIEGSMDLVKGFAASLKNLIFSHKVDMVVLLETRISGDKAKKANRSFGFRYSEIVEALGFVGGIWLIWNNSNLVVNVMERHLQFLHCQLMIGGKIPWYFTAVYASPHENVRGELWEKLDGIATTMTDLWLLAGDWNEISTCREQKEGGRVNEGRCRRFRDGLKEAGSLIWVHKCLSSHGVDLNGVDMSVYSRG